jgi:hypothetical protein
MLQTHTGKNPVKTGFTQARFSSVQVCNVGVNLIIER